MSVPAGVLIVEGDPRALRELRDAFAHERGLRLSVASSGAEAIEMAERLEPILVIVGHQPTGQDVFQIIQRFRSDTVLIQPMIVMLGERAARDARLMGLTLGVDDFVYLPVDAAEVLAKLNVARRWHRQRMEAGGPGHAPDSAHHPGHDPFEQLLQLMVHVIDMRIPGAADRGNRRADMSVKLAARFGVPDTHVRDLVLAARLLEIGRVASNDAVDSAEPAAEHSRDVRHVQSTRAILERVEGLHHAAELVGALFENWDGTGYPARIVSGQIPLRSRILRIVVDFFAEANASPTLDTADIVERLAEHRGTQYDPMVIVHLRAVLGGAAEEEWRSRVVHLPVTALREGMVLAEDLYTDAGLKLLARETVVTHASLELILRRHHLEPILQGAVVLRQP